MRVVRTLAGLALATAALAGLLTKAVHGGETVEALHGRTTVRQAEEDDAYYRCLDLQARSLVSPGRPVLVEGPDLGSYVTLLKAVGSWVTFAERHSPAAVALSLRSRRGPGTCRGTVVVATQTTRRGRTTTRVGSGASLPGHGPPPAPPL